MDKAPGKKDYFRYFPAPAYSPPAPARASLPRPAQCGEQCTDRACRQWKFLLPYHGYPGSAAFLQSRGSVLLRFCTTMSCPDEMPPRMPPAWLLANPVFRHRVVVPAPEPARNRKTVPDLDSLDGADAHHGPGNLCIQFPEDRSPSPAGQPFASISTTPPTESPSAFAARISASIAAASVFPWTETILPVMVMPFMARYLRARAPAATRPTVSLPELLPPPRWSRMPYFSWYVTSAWPGRKTSRRAS